MELGDSMVSPLPWVSAATLRIGDLSVIGRSRALVPSKGCLTILPTNTDMKRLMRFRMPPVWKKQESPEPTTKPNCMYQIGKMKQNYQQFRNWLMTENIFGMKSAILWWKSMMMIPCQCYLDFVMCVNSDQILIAMNSRTTRTAQSVQPTTHLGRSVPTTLRM